MLKIEVPYTPKAPEEKRTDELKSHPRQPTESNTYTYKDVVTLPSIAQPLQQERTKTTTSTTRSNEGVISNTRGANVLPKSSVPVSTLKSHPRKSFLKEDFAWLKENASGVFFAYFAVCALALVVSLIVIIVGWVADTGHAPMWTWLLWESLAIGIVSIIGVGTSE